MTVLADQSQDYLVNASRERELLAEIAALKARLTKQASAGLRLKVSEKGAVSLYGMGRWPVTLYRSQWERLLAHADAIRDFLADNSDMLSEKGD